MVVVIDSSVPHRVARLQPVWRKCITTTIRPVSTIVLIGLSETNTIGYYRNAYPEWWKAFHADAPQDQWFGKTWEPLLPRAAYTRSASDNRAYHTNYRALGAKFPHTVTGGLAKPGKDYYEALAWTPFGDEYLLAFTKAAVQGENLGKNAHGVPDLLAVSFSSHDY